MGATTTATWNAAAASAVIDTLAANGVEHAVISPGSRSTPLVLAAHQRLKTTVVLDERVAGFFALGVSRRLGNCALICTSGTAGAHYYPAVIEAAQSRTSLVILTADRPAHLQDCGAPQTIRQHGLYGEHVRYTSTLPTPNGLQDVYSAAKITSRAILAASGSPAGPVHLNVPFQKPLWEVDSASTAVPQISVPTVGISGQNTPDIQSVTEVVQRAECPVIYVGPHASQTVWEAACTTGRALGVPVLTELSPPEHNIAHLDVIVRSDAFQKEVRPDVLLHVGHAPICRGVIEWMADFNGTYIALDPDGWHHSATHPAHYLWSGDVATALAQLADCRKPLHSSWLSVWTQASAAAVASLESVADCFDERSIAVLTSAHRAGMHVASSMPIRDVAAFGRPKGVTYSRGTNGIDGTISTALGLEAGTVLLGDLALRHDISGLVAANEMRADLDVVCVDNSGGGIFHLLPISHHREAFETYFATPQRTSLSRLITGTGAEAVYVESASALSRVLDEPADGVRVIVAVVDRESSVQSRAEAIDRAVQAVDSVFLSIGSEGLR